MSIKCSNCGADNRDGAKFCGVCGTKLTLVAPQQPIWTPLPAPPPGVPAPYSPGQVSTYPPQPQPIAPHGMPLGFPKAWTGAQPLIEGKVLHMDAPVQEKGSVAGKVAAAGCLALIAPVLAFIPFIQGAQITVRYMRVEDWQTGQQRSVKMRGEPSGIISVGDWLAIWGKEQGGNIIMNVAHNYTTDAEIRVKK
jgi:hypothetical protein